MPREVIEFLEFMATTRNWVGAGWQGDPSSPPAVQHGNSRAKALLAKYRGAE